MRWPAERSPVQVPVLAFVAGLEDEQWPWFAGVVFGAGAFLVALPFGVVLWSVPLTPAGLVVGASLGAGLGGGWAWKHGVEHREVTSYRRGMLAGVVAVVTAYPTMWGCYYLLVVTADTSLMTGSRTPIEGLAYVVFLLLASVVVTGLVTFPAGAAIGAGLVAVRKRVGDPVRPQRTIEDI